MSTRLPAPDQLEALADAVVAAGFEANRRDVDDLVTTARRFGVRPLMAEVVADPTAPRPVRERALGRLVVALSATAGAPVTTGAASAA